MKLELNLIQEDLNNNLFPKPFLSAIHKSEVILKLILILCIVSTSGNNPFNNPLSSRKRKFPEIESTNKYEDEREKLT